MTRNFHRILGAAALLMITTTAQAGDYDQRPELKSFIGRMAQEHDFDRDRLVKLFRHVNRRQDIINAISRPAEGKPWHQYRKIFLIEKRIARGVKFWDQHVDALTRAEIIYGVPAEIIVAIIGVETLYGAYRGKYRVLDALATLGFDYPKRSKFFSSELEQYLLLTREEGFDPLSLKGSYAGAMGLPQFISSSYRNYAIDFDNDNKRDLLNNPTDSIGSVANYFKRHGWQPGGAIAWPVEVGGKQYKPLLSLHGKPEHSVGTLIAAGVRAPEQVDRKTPAAILEFKQANGHDHLLAMNNFYVITRYNHSKLYARAVWELSQAIAERRNTTR